MSSDAAAASGPPVVGGARLRPTAVVWCRQVDNEAQSPGYSTVPNEFEGLRETMEAVRSVGHIAINLADTHDYWDPDPATTLAFYPNLFLYPAAGGRYTCVGRMFLSKEDRPRLGMKTAVLETASLREPGEFGGAVTHWQAMLPETPGEAESPVARRDRDLIAPVAEGLLFPRGAHDPVLLIASERWGSVMSVLLHLLRALPSAIVSRGAILSFPYFVPSNSLGLDALQRKIPVSFLLMREPRPDVESPRHARRVQSWRAAKTTVLDLTAATPASASRRREGHPVLMGYLRDGPDRRLAELRARVDAVELPRQQDHRPDGSPWTASDQRKQIGGIADAMEATALRLEHPHGRVPSAGREVVRRSQEYLSATPAPRRRSLPEGVVGAPGPLAPPSSEAIASGVFSGAVPPPKKAAHDPVPVSRKHHVPPPAAPPAGPAGRSPGAPPSSPAGPGLPAIADAHLAVLLGALEERMSTRLADGLRTSTAAAREGAALASAAAATAARQQEEALKALREKLEGKPDRTEAAPKDRLDQLERDLRSALDTERAERAALEARLTKFLRAGADAARPSTASGHDRESKAIHRKIEETEARLHGAAEARALAHSREHRESITDLQARLEARLSAALEEEHRRHEALLARVRDELEALRRTTDPSPSSAEPRARPATSEELVALEAALRSDLAELRTRTEQLSTRLVPIVRRAWAKIEELELQRLEGSASGPPAAPREPTAAPPEAIPPPARKARRSARKGESEASDLPD